MKTFWLQFVLALSLIVSGLLVLSYGYYGSLIAGPLMIGFGLIYTVKLFKEAAE